MDINILRELECSYSYGWWTKGHHEPEKFLEECDRQHGSPFRGVALAKNVIQQWWRKVPFKGTSDMIFVDGEKGRGAFPVTLVEWVHAMECRPNTKHV